MGDVIEVQKTAKLGPTLAATALGLLPVTQACLGMSFTTPAIVYYRQPDISVIEAPLTDDQVSWLASVSSALTFVGTLASSFLTDRLGRKRTLMLGGLMQVVAWALLLLSQEFPFLMANRILCGISSGVTQPATLTYLTDISLVWLRGPLGVMSILVMNGSWMISLAVVAMVDFQICIKIMIAPVLLFFLLFHKLPESPVWLVKQNEVSRAEEALRRLRGPDYNVAPEMKELRETQNIERKMSRVQKNEKGNEKDEGPKMNSRPFLAPLTLMFVLALMQGWIGIDLLSYYSLDIYSALNMPMDKYVLSLGQQGVITVAYILSAGISTRVPRRRHFLTATCAFTLIMLAATVCLQTKEEAGMGPMEVRVALFPLAVMASFVAYGLGMGPVIFSLIGEIFPPTLKGAASGIIFGVRNMAVFIVLKSFPTLRSLVGLRGIFVLQTLGGLISFITAFFFMPETLGLSLTQLAAIYQPKSKAARVGDGDESDGDNINATTV